MAELYKSRFIPEYKYYEWLELLSKKEDYKAYNNQIYIEQLYKLIIKDLRELIFAFLKEQNIILSESDTPLYEDYMKRSEYTDLINDWANNIAQTIIRNNKAETNRQTSRNSARAANAQNQTVIASAIAAGFVPQRARAGSVNSVANQAAAYLDTKPTAAPTPAPAPPAKWGFFGFGGYRKRNRSRKSRTRRRRLTRRLR